jgi:hypothetical protein
MAMFWDFKYRIIVKKIIDTLTFLYDNFIIRPGAKKASAEKYCFILKEEANVCCSYIKT